MCSLIKLHGHHQSPTISCWQRWIQSCIEQQQSIRSDYKKGNWQIVNCNIISKQWLIRDAKPMIAGRRYLLGLSFAEVFVGGKIKSWSDWVSQTHLNKRKKQTNRVRVEAELMDLFLNRVHPLEWRLSFELRQRSAEDKHTWFKKLLWWEETIIETRMIGLTVAFGCWRMVHVVRGFVHEVDSPPWSALRFET